ncbi:uncharacterized protein C8Q71DRAFT_740760 [Rhodofomes roseus]|uniref:Uncharacterized protein n=1 Tax=Rhodofomes roseus TaxID=34475 RepID=A0ABQ8KQ91_9APHY|nr:uncharacterized protein C8Q71DRAFT_740760 [Rhodofomes roseus]KAH9840680.1 hypothetical protein C8Q71DRAFT_740760 [Rhodofomes roseus]
MRVAYLSFLAYALTVLGAPVVGFSAVAQPSGFPGSPFELTVPAGSAASASTSPALSNAEVLPTVAARHDHDDEDLALVGGDVDVNVGIHVQRASSTDFSEHGPVATTDPAPAPTSTDASYPDPSAPADIAGLLSNLLGLVGEVVNDIAGPNGTLPGILGDVTNLVDDLTGAGSSAGSSTGSSGSSGDGASVDVHAGVGVHANVDSVASSGPPPPVVDDVNQLVGQIIQLVTQLLTIL